MLKLHLVQVQALYFKALNSSVDSTVGVCFLDDPQNLTIRIVTYRNFDFPNTFPYDLIQYISVGTTVNPLLSPPSLISPPFSEEEG